jgi:hypothetical protein
MTNLQTEHAELQEQFAELQQKYADAQKRITELEKLVARKPEDIERECFHSGIKFKIGPSTRGRWMPFCPKCGLPVNDATVPTGISRWASCSAGCGWVGVELDLKGGMDALVAEIGA